MKVSKPLPPSDVLPEGYVGIGRYLWEAHPLLVPTHAVAKAVLARPNGILSTAVKRAWRALNELRKRKLVASVNAPTDNGRPPAHWHLTERGLLALRGLGMISAAEMKAKPKGHKALRALLARRHDLLVQEVKAEILFGATNDGRLRVVNFCHDRSCWLMVKDAAGVEHSVAPDLVAQLTIDGAPVVWFIEVQGTASPLSAVEEKVRGFKAYFTSGLAERTYGCRNFRILFLTFSYDPDGGIDHRNNIVETVGLVGGADRLTFVATVKDVVEHGIGAPVFVRPAEYKAAVANLHPAVQEHFVDVRHAGNALRKERDGFVETLVTKVRLLG